MRILLAGVGGMKKDIVVTDSTRMGGERVCIAGYTRDGRCIRPELARGFFAEWWLDHGTSGLVRPFAVLEFDLLRPERRAPHTEDWIVASGPPVFRGSVPESERLRCLQGISDADVVTIFGASIHQGRGFWVAAGEGARSLGTVRAHNLTVYHQPKSSGEGWDYRVPF